MMVKSQHASILHSLSLMSQTTKLAAPRKMSCSSFAQSRSELLSGFKKKSNQKISGFILVVLGLVTCHHLTFAENATFVYFLVRLVEDSYPGTF